MHTMGTLYEISVVGDQIRKTHARFFLKKKLKNDKIEKNEDLKIGLK